MIYRHQVLRNLQYDKLADFLSLQKEKNALLVGAGLAPYTVWAPAFGGLHHLVLEAEFGSLAEFEAHQAGAKAIPGYSKANAEQMTLVLPGTASDRMVKLSLAGVPDEG